MNYQEKLEYLISPEKFFPADIKRGSLLGNKPFIEAIGGYLDVLSESQYWPRANLEELQTARLRKFTGLIESKSSFWAEYFHRYNFSPNLAKLEDLRRLPILDRKSLLELGDKTYLNPGLDESTFAYYSSGTTGVSLKHFYSEREFLINFTVFLFRHPAFEKFSLSKLLSRKSFVVLGRPGFRHVFEKDFFYKNFPFIRSSDLENVDLRKDIYTSIRNAAPAFLVGYGSLIAKLAEWIIEDGEELPILAVRTTSEPISTFDRELIGRAIKAPVINMLSGNGIGLIGFECPSDKEFFHANSETLIIEIVGDNSEFQERAEGELIITSFAYSLNPFIRHAHKDIGQFLSYACNCGRTLPIFKFHGRREYEIILPSGRKIGMMYLYRLFSGIVMGESRLGRIAKQSQIIQNRIDSLLLLIVPRKKISETDELRIRLALVELFDGERINIEIKCVDVIPSGRDSKPSFFVPLSEFQERQL